MKDKRKQPRWFQHFRALLGGYFWLPCPICGQYFGGNEEPSGDWYTGYGGGKITCANCIDESQRRSLLQKRSEGWYNPYLEGKAELLGLPVVTLDEFKATEQFPPVSVPTDSYTGKPINK